jgi:hypothetical protein
MGALDEVEFFRFWLDSAEYIAPRDWITQELSKELKQGLMPNIALGRVLEAWVKIARPN